MNQYIITENTLILKVKKSPVFIRSILFLFSFLFFVLPIVGMAGYIFMRKGFHASFLFGIFFFGLLGFYLLRISLWNTYGKEEITFNGNQVSYVADYGWFKDSLKTKEINIITYSIRPIGYEDDNEGALVIGECESTIECVTKMPISDIEKLIEKLKEVDFKK